MKISAEFGVYVMTYPGDFHLSTMLVRSIQAVSSTLPIMIIPGEGFDLDNHPFDVPVLPLPTSGFWKEIGHQDRDFWAFQGPFKTFLYLDADTIVVKSLDSLAQRISRQQGDFIYIQSVMDDERWQAVIQNPEHPDHNLYRQTIARDIGRGPLSEFDPDHDFLLHKPFNSGVFAGSRLAINESDLAALNEAERKFYRENLDIEDWTWKSSELFFRDQGRLNYLVRKLSIPTFPLEPELICVSGASSVSVSVDDVKNSACDFHVIHWMGSKAPTPSYFCTKPLFSLYAYLWAYVGRETGRFVRPNYEQLQECTGYSVWRFHYQLAFGSFSLPERLRWSLRDLKRVLILLGRWLRISARKSIARYRDGNAARCPRQA
jgi:hypothetical protein